MRHGRIAVVAALAVLAMADAGWAADFTVPESKLLDAEFATAAWGGAVAARSDAPGDAVDFAFSGLGAEPTGVKDDYPVDTVYGQTLPSHGNGDFSGLTGYALRIENLDAAAVEVSLVLNTGFTGPSGTPTDEPANDTFWQSPWQTVPAGEVRMLRLDFDRAVPWQIEDNPEPHTQGTNGVTTAINLTDRTEVTAIGFQVRAAGNAEATLRVSPAPTPAVRIVDGKFFEVDGERFLPIAVWAQHENMFDFWADLGINTMMSGGKPRQDISSVQNYINTGVAHGLMVSVGLSWIESENAESLVLAADNVLSIHLPDEPDLADRNTGEVPRMSPEELAVEYEAARAGFNLPVTCTFTMGFADIPQGWWTPPPEETYVEYFDTGCDAMGFDIYPLNIWGDHIEYNAQAIDEMLALQTDRKPIYPWLECGEIHADRTQARAPTPTELRATVYMSLIHGATMIGYFPQQISPSFKFENVPPELETEMLRTNTEVTALAEVILSDPPAGGMSLVADGGERIDWMLRAGGGRLYLFAVNMGDVAATATITAEAGWDPATGHEVVADEPVVFSGNQASVSFEPWGTKIIHLDGAPGPQVTDWSIVSQHGAQEVEIATADGYVHPLIVGPTTLHVQLSEAIDPATATPSAVALSGQTAGDLSSLVASVTASTDNTAITIELDDPLTDDHYTLTLLDALTDPEGRPVAGGATLEFACLAGDTDGSGVVTAADVTAVRDAAGEALTSATARYDVNASGAVTAADMLAVQRRVGASLP